MQTQAVLESQDLRMNVYFQNKRIREHLIQAGLINRRGVILPAAIEAEPKPRKPKIPLVITDYMIEEERKRRLFLQKYFETAIKREKVQKIRESKRAKPRGKSLDFHDTTEKLNARTRSSERHPVKRPTSSRPVQLWVKNLLPPRPTTAKSRVGDNNCEVTLIYYGPPKNAEKKYREADEIIVMQQHNGGENLLVFKGFVRPNQIFHFKSLRHPDYPFALAIYINGLIDTRISVCCEYKHKHNVRLGSKYGQFGIFDVQKSQPCTMCRFEKRRKEILVKSPVSPYQRSSELSSNCRLRTPLTTPEKKSPKKVNRISTLAQASETSRLSSDDDDDNNTKKKQNVSIHTEPIRKVSISTGSSSDRFPKRTDLHHSSEPILSSKRNDNDDSNKSLSTFEIDESDNEKEKNKSRSSSSSSSHRSTPTQEYIPQRSKSPSTSNNSFNFIDDKPPSRRGSSSTASTGSNKIETFSHKDNQLKSPTESNNSWKLTEDTTYNTRPIKSPSIKSNTSSQHSRPPSKTSNRSEKLNRTRTPSPSPNAFKLLADLALLQHDSGSPSARSSSSASIHLPNKDNRSRSSSNSTVKQSSAKDTDEDILEQPKQPKVSSSNSSIRENFNRHYSTDEETQKNTNFVPIKATADSSDDEFI